MKLILLGGVAGVGKTTIFNQFRVKLDKRVIFLDPGELFRQYCYVWKIKTAEEVEEMILDQLMAMPRDATVVVHWHYAVSRPGGYITQISFARLAQLAKSGKIDRVILVSVGAPTDVILERRLRDSNKKKRNLDRQMIEEEVKQDQEFLIKHRDLLIEILGEGRVVVHHFANI